MKSAPPFHSSIINNSLDMETTKVTIDDYWLKRLAYLHLYLYLHIYIHTHTHTHIHTMEYYSAIKMTIWRDLAAIMLSETSDRERQILYDLTYMWNFKKTKPNKQKSTKFIEKRSYLWLSEAESWSRGNWRKVVKKYKFPVIS